MGAVDPAARAGRGRPARWRRSRNPERAAVECRARSRRRAGGRVAAHLAWIHAGIAPQRVDRCRCGVRLCDA
jgi:hypothetical protein